MPFQVIEEMGYREHVDSLVVAGLWTHVDGGYRTEDGPGTDWPRPLWRYGTDPGDGRLIAIMPDPEAGD